jgi:HlyD family secretion protein
VSPIDGIVIERNVDRGQTVAASLQAPTLFKIAQDLSQVQIEAQVDEADIGGVREGQEVTFTVGAYSQREFRGQVAQVRVGGLSEQSVVTYSVMISAPNRNLDLLPGMTASVKISTGRRDNALRLPNEALRFRPPSALQAPATTARTGGNQGAARREAMIADLTKALSLTETQQAALREASVAATQRRRNGGGGRNNEGNTSESGGDNPEASGQPAPGPRRNGGGGFDRGLTAAIEPLLTPAQKQKLQEWRANRGRTQRAQVWVLRSGAPAQVTVMLGINDDRYSEIVGGDLKEGDEVLTRYVEPSA